MPAPKGNLNAFKHGLYSEQLKSAVQKDIDTLSDAGSRSDLVNEIAMLRIAINHTMKLAEGIQDVENAIKWLSVLGASTTRIASLLRTQKLLGASQGNELDLISLALDQLAADWGLKQTDSPI